MTLMTSWAKARRAHENRAYVRELLWKREPTFAAALAAAEQNLSCPACPCRQQELVVHRLSAATRP
jgi:hypothetical protein